MCCSSNSGSTAGDGSSSSAGESGCSGEQAYSIRRLAIAVSADKRPGVHRTRCESPDCHSGVDCAGGEDGGPVTDVEGGTGWYLQCLYLGSILVFGGGAAVSAHDFSLDLCWGW